MISTPLLRRIRRGIPLIVGTLAMGLVLSTGFVFTTEKAAYAYPPGCHRGALCVYPDLRFTGGSFEFYNNNRSWKSWNINNNDESVFNKGRTGRASAVYNYTGYRGFLYCLDKNMGYPDLGRYGNKGTSNRWPWSCPR